MDPKQRQTAYDALICPAGDKTMGRNGCCVILDRTGALGGTTGKCARFGDQGLQDAIERAQQQRFAQFAKEEKKRQAEEKAAMEKRCRRGGADQAKQTQGGWLGAVEKTVQQAKDVADCKKFKQANQSIWDHLMSDPSVWVAGACCVAGGVLYFTM